MRRTLTVENWNSAEMRYVTERVGFTMIGGGVTLIYPDGEHRAPLWLMDGSMVCRVEVSLYRFAQLLCGGRLHMHTTIYKDRGVQGTSWNYIDFPKTHRQVMGDGTYISVRHVAELARERIGVEP
jgi:hypothetical protein